jgi:hypothetical protein
MYTCCKVGEVLDIGDLDWSLIQLPDLSAQRRPTECRSHAGTWSWRSCSTQLQTTTMFWLNSAAPERVTHVAVDRGASDEKTRRRSGQRVNRQ